MRKQKLISVRFIVANAPYMAREIAGFPEAVAKRFVDRKRAVYSTPPEEDQPEAEAEVAVEEEVASAAEIVPKKLSGPYYMVGDEKIKGKAKAYARAAELNEA